MITSAQAYTPGAQLDRTRSLLIAMKEKGTLQSYVAQHKNSPEYPYLLALASSIDQVSNAAKAAQHEPPQQTVADQKLGALAPAPAPQPMMQLPEESGIAQLPTENIEGMAGGGIVAFDEGGEVPRFQEGGMSYSEQMRKLGEFFNPVTRFRQLVGDPSMRASAIPPVASTAFVAPESTIKGTGSTADIDQMATDLAAQQTKGTKQNDVVQRPPATTTPKPGFESVDAYSKQLMGIDSLLPAKEKAKDRSAFMAEREEIGKPYYDKAMKMVESEKNKLKDDREQSFYMSLIEGGLAAAGGSSQYGLQNLAQGFAKGAAGFGDALKDLRKAARENSKMEVEIERMKAADKRGDMDAYQKHEDAIRESNAKIDQLKTSGIFGLMGDKMRADATVKAAGIAASAPSAQERLFATLGGGDVTKGFKVFQEAQQDKTGASYAKLYSDYAANADKTGADKMTPIEFAQNIQLFMGALGGGGFQSKPGDTTVRKLPGT
jgi:hypothetical protein